MLKRIRDGSSIGFSFRCDSPKCRRLLQMDVCPLTDDTIEFRTRILSEEPQSIPNLASGSDDQNEQPLHLCGWCGKIRFGNEWLEVETAISRLNLFHQSQIPPISHGICPRCYKKLQKSL